MEEGGTPQTESVEFAMELEVILSLFRPIQILHIWSIPVHVNTLVRYALIGPEF